MPNYQYKHCLKCDATNTDDYRHCNKCNELIYLSMEKSELGKKASDLLIADIENIITLETYKTKRDRLLHLQKITKDKYLTKLKKEVEKI